MKKRMLIVIAGLVVLIAGLGFFKYRQIQAAIKGGAWTPPPEAVTTTVATEAQWEGTLHAIGSATAVNGVVVSADLPGVVSSIEFESGRAVKKGAVLVRLDTRTERAQLASAVARRDLAKLDFDRVTHLREQNANSQADLDRAGAEAKQAEAAVAELQAVIERKTIRAPFAGVLGIRQVNLGQYLAGGDPVVPVQADAPIFVDFSVPQQAASGIKAGDQVHVVKEGTSEAIETGKINAVNSLIDSATRNVTAQATFANKSHTLQPGMFCEVAVMLGESAKVVALPASSISYAPYGNSVFIVEEMEGPDKKKYKGVRQQFVKLGDTRGDQVAVISGVTAGQEVVSSGVFKLRSGAAVQVNNNITPSNTTEPKPADS
ncbi:MAG TPA: efflux RND transporter periplasmic adaptor subunit [Candidatus Krumholzibacteria bacterium]|jgi:membrane fusion protein (multidrug efflux system)|nr:efflux RND transporter periplasmic adaptor subunit [Candidatus Krumholzibacteria bacterium]